MEKFCSEDGMEAAVGLPAPDAVPYCSIASLTL
jgi:hypothetical protein